MGTRVSASSRCVALFEIGRSMKRGVVRSYSIVNSGRAKTVQTFAHARLCGGEVMRIGGHDG
jgi:hypothetical protein